MDEKIKQNREFLKATLWEDRSAWESDQQKDIPQPEFQKSYPKDAELIDLPHPKELNFGKAELVKIIDQRRSRRKFNSESLSLEELSYLLWATQGVRQVIGERTYRTVPSGGARHAFETYLYINRVNGLANGIYRYLPLEHKLLFLYTEDNLSATVNDAALGQTFVGNAAVVFFWTSIPYRAEWRYALTSHKMILIDAGHLCQNLYLAAESIGGGTVAIGAYSQSKTDAILKVDGVDEMTVYLAPVGKIKA